MRAKALLLLLSIVLAANAQEVGRNKSGEQTMPTFKVTSHLVIETVSVTDKNGAPIEGLQAKDFIVTEDGGHGNELCPFFPARSVPAGFPEAVRSAYSREEAAR